MNTLTNEQNEAMKDAFRAYFKDAHFSTENNYTLKRELTKLGMIRTSRVDGKLKTHLTFNGVHYCWQHFAPKMK